MELYKAANLFFMFIWLSAPVCIAVHVLQYQESLTVAPGQTVNITCALKNQTGLERFVYHWYMKPAHPKRYYKEEPVKNTSRISHFLRENHSYTILTIDNVSAYDDGEYSCRAHFYTTLKEQIVNKTLLFVKATPEIRLLARSVNERRSLICSAVGFYPRDLNLYWVYSPSGEPEEPEEQGSFMLNSDGTYSKNASLQFEKGMWNGTEITCLVNHTLHVQRISYAVSSETERSDSVTLTCSTLSPYPPRVTLSWDSPPGGPRSSQRGPPSLIQDGTYSTNASLQIERSRWDDGFEVACVLKPRLSDERIIDDGNHGKWYYCSLIVLVGSLFVVPLMGCALKRCCRKPKGLPDQKPHRRYNNGDEKCEDDLHYTTIQYKKQETAMMRGGNDQASESIVYAALELQSRAPCRPVADRDHSTEYAAAAELRRTRDPVSNNKATQPFTLQR
ncbi:tapasin-related protein-like [Huso huso]|uniref:Tapasin-related protein-like n=1 Tax=Huso huso TaxID=61971 RepID=A0ABR0YAX8_HUSHU